MTGASRFEPSVAVSAARARFGSETRDSRATSRPFDRTFPTSRDDAADERSRRLPGPVRPEQREDLTLSMSRSTGFKAPGPRHIFAQAADRNDRPLPNIVAPMLIAGRHGGLLSLLTLSRGEAASGCCEGEDEGTRGDPQTLPVIQLSKISWARKTSLRPHEGEEDGQLRVSFISPDRSALEGEAEQYFSRARRR